MKPRPKNQGWGNCEVCGAKNVYTSKLCQCGAILPWVKPHWGNCSQCGEPYPYNFKQCQCGAILPWAEETPAGLQKLFTAIVTGFALRSVEGHRKKFREGPIGGWSGVDVIWQFNPDGTGWYQQLAGFSPPDAEYPIVWNLDAPFTISIKELPRDIADGADDDDDEELYPWVQVRYDFKWVSDYGQKSLVMADVVYGGVLDEYFAKAFFEVFPLGPVTYSGPNETPR